MRLPCREGLAEGIAKGEAKGKAEGIAERDINLVKNLSKKGLSPEDVSNLLEVDLEKVLEILKS